MTNYEYLDLNTLEQLLAQNQNNLQIIEVQLAEHGVSKPVYLVNQRNTTNDVIAAIKVAINQRKNQEQQTSSTSKVQAKEIQIIVEGDINQVDDLYIKKLKYKLAILLDLDISQIRILRYFSGSIRFIIELPEDSAQKLLSLYLSGTLKMEGIKVKEVTFGQYNQIVEKPMKPKVELTEPKAIIKGAWIGAAAVIIAAIIGILKFMPNDTFNYQVEVLDNSTNKPISQAKVTITLPNLAPLEAFSDNNGFARISISDEYNQQAGRLSIEKAGYDSAMFNVDLQADRLPKQIKLNPNQSNNPQPTTTTEIPTAGGATAPLLIGCWNNDKKPRDITNINIRESNSGIKIGFKTNCADSAITDELDAVISAENEIRLSKAAETWVFSLRPEGTLRLAIEGQTGFEELTFYKK